MRWLDRIRPSKLITCESCGTAHRLEEMHITFGHPDAYLSLTDQQRERWEEDTDFARLDLERFFFRALIEIPVRRKKTAFGYGVWIEVDEQTFARYGDIFRTEGQARERPMAGALANRIPAYQPTTLGLAVDVQMRPAGLRPLAAIREPGHQLAIDQTRGFTIDEILDLHHTLFPPNSGT